jgi:hypothetical protein
LKELCDFCTPCRVFASTQTIIQHRKYAGKTTVLVLNGKCLFCKVFLSTACNKVSTPSLAYSLLWKFEFFIVDMLQYLLYFLESMHK